MRIVNARDLGLYIRDRRRDLKLTQAGLAAAAGVSRRWLLSVESGKPTAEIGLVLRTLHALGLMLDAQPESASPGAIDLDELLASMKGQSDE